MTTKYNKNERGTIEGILDKNFMHKVHRTNMETALKKLNRKFLISFRAAGPFSIEKLSYGAAAKPHSILDKTIKPNELPLWASYMGVSVSEIDKTGKAKTWNDLATRFLCGLVGVRVEAEVCGLFLSQMGAAIIESVLNNTSHLGKVCESKLGRPFVQCENTTNLLVLLQYIYKSMSNMQLNSNLDLTSISCAELFKALSPLFITGDYDLHDLHVKSEAGEPEDKPEEKYLRKWHQPSADNDEEAWCLYTLAMSMCDDKNISCVRGSNFEPQECCPIQHGVQAAYIDHMFHKEQNSRLVPKVLYPDTYIAVYNSEKDEWCTIFNEGTSENEVAKNQMTEINNLYKEYNAPCFLFWDSQNDRAQIMLQNLENNTPMNYKEFVEGKIMTKKIEYDKKLSEWLGYCQKYRTSISTNKKEEGEELKKAYMNSYEDLNLLKREYRILELAMWDYLPNNEKKSDK